ncbi:MAG: Abi family protein, partial [Granulicatella sp.]
MGEKGKSIDGLMRHIRNNHNVLINGSKHKRTLRNIGYFHGYKAYKFVHKKNNPLSFTTFDEIRG